MRKEFGSYVRALRERKKLSAREVARSIGMDSSNYAKIERGELRPPSTSTLGRLAFSLGIDPDYDDRWYDFLYRAEVAKGKIPQDLMRRDDMVAILPSLFNYLRTTELHMGDAGTRLTIEEVAQKFPGLSAHLSTKSQNKAVRLSAKHRKE